jgi:hypothetical protein
LELEAQMCDHLDGNGAIGRGKSQKVSVAEPVLRKFETPAPRLASWTPQTQGMKTPLASTPIAEGARMQTPGSTTKIEQHMLQTPLKKEVRTPLPLAEGSRIRTPRGVVKIEGRDKENSNTANMEQNAGAGDEAKIDSEPARIQDARAVKAIFEQIYERWKQLINTQGNDVDDKEEDDIAIENRRKALRRFESGTSLCLCFHETSLMPFAYKVTYGRVLSRKERMRWAY